MTRVEIGDVLRALGDERDALRSAHDGGLGGLALVRALSEAMDRAVSAIWEQIAEDRLALVALGGYARAELSPHSDVDLMVLHAGSRRAPAVSQHLFYALWDAGFRVGHATRTVKDCLRLARESIEAETSFLRPRLVAGDTALFERLAAGARAATRRRSRVFVEDVRRMMRARHATGGPATSQLEPNLKEGAGGLRDLHALGWFEAIVEEDEDIAVERDRERLAAAAEILHRVRNHVHYLTDAPSDVLLFQHQRPVALHLGYADGERPAEDAFMRDLFGATRAVEHVVSAVVRELSARGAKPARAVDPAACFAIQGERVVVVRRPDLSQEPARVLELFSLGAPPGAAALRWLADALEPLDALPWTDAVRRAFFGLLRAGDPELLEDADHAGLLTRLLPEWEGVRCQPQRNVYHAFTVDAHLFHTVAALRALAGDEDEFAREVWADVADHDGLMLAGLLHDAGKGTSADHAARGEQIALAILDRMGIGEPRRGAVAWLVRHHLLLVEAATRRDLNDENFVVDVAGRIGDPQRARMLYLLSVADGRATGPTAWTPWKGALVTELFSKVLHVIERGELVSSDAEDLARLRTAELRAALAREPGERVERHLAGLSRAYLLAFPTQSLARQYALMSEPVGDDDARGHAIPAGEPDVYEYTLVARDRPGLFSKVSGAIALNGVNIVSAAGFVRADGVAVETFRCVGEFERAIADARWERITDDVRRALTGRLSLPERLADKRRAYEGRVARGKREPPKVVVDNGASDFLTVVEVHASDRVGLLYDITSGLADLGLDIQVAKIATFAEDVVDVFYLRDLTGQKVADAMLLADIERTLLRRVAG